MALLLPAGDVNETEVFAENLQAALARFNQALEKIKEREPTNYDGRLVSILEYAIQSRSLGYFIKVQEQGCNEETINTWAGENILENGDFQKLKIFLRLERIKNIAETYRNRKKRREDLEVEIKKLARDGVPTDYIPGLTGRNIGEMIYAPQKKHHAITAIGLSLVLAAGVGIPFLAKKYNQLNNVQETESNTPAKIKYTFNDVAKPADWKKVIQLKIDNELIKNHVIAFLDKLAKTNIMQGDQEIFSGSKILEKIKENNKGRKLVISHDPKKDLATTLGTQKTDKGFEIDTKFIERAYCVALGRIQRIAFEETLADAIAKEAGFNQNQASSYTFAFNQAMEGLERGKEKIFLMNTEGVIHSKLKVAPIAGLH